MLRWVSTVCRGYTNLNKWVLVILYMIVSSLMTLRWNCQLLRRRTRFDHSSSGIGAHRARSRAGCACGRPGPCHGTIICAASISHPREQPVAEVAARLAPLIVRTGLSGELKHGRGLRGFGAVGVECQVGTGPLMSQKSQVATRVRRVARAQPANAPGKTGRFWTATDA